MSILLINNSYL